MAISNDRVHQINLLQENLQTIRKIAGWTIEDLGEKIGVSKQTISNLENLNTKMSLTQYIAIRAVLDYEVKEHPENDVLPKAVQLLLDEENKFSAEEFVKIKEALDTVAAAISGGADQTVVSKLFNGVLGSATSNVGIGSLLLCENNRNMASALWLKSILDRN